MSLKLNRYFTERDAEKGVSVYDAVEWIEGKSDISDDSGKVIFVQENVRSPKAWSGLARNIVASKYFYGKLGNSERESSVRQLIERVSETFGGWALEQGYFSEKESEIFRDEIAFLCLNQLMAFNSPVWFNVGVDRYQSLTANKEQRPAFIIRDGNAILIPLGEEYSHPQCSACFIQGVRDDMSDIMDLAKKEAMLFKYGSGTGTDLSTLRSAHELLSGGGKPSGPLAYLLFYDKVAAIVKSGGKTRRAAKMNSLKAEHPDIREFIEAKSREQDKLEALVREGYSKEEAGATVGYQNANFSVRASDEFMRAVLEDREWQTVPVHSKELAEKMPKYKAKELLQLIAKGTHRCGEPGMQFDDTINRAHTCPNSRRINASNPCSEFMFLNDSSCNLASLKLTAFLEENGSFNIKGYEAAVRTTAIAQDALIDRASYPTKEIAENSHRFRPLGTGYADLGAFLMALALPYDSDEGRAVASAITSLHTGAVYLVSTEMAEKLGAFKEFEKNKEPMLKIIEMHKAEAEKIDTSKLPENYKKIAKRAKEIWALALERGREYGFRNAQATNLAPTGTIGFMMDCDTTGVEPEMGLVKYKSLAGGGELKLVNRAIRPALKRMGYTAEDIERIVKYVDERGTIEGAPEIKSEHLSVFDCAFKPKNGSRFLHYRGHIKMLAAIQPHISGGISKTVDLPEEATLEEIAQTYVDAWKMGVKSVTIYRDGSRKDQPVSLSKGKKQERVKSAVRRKLPTTRESITHKFNVADHEGYITVGLYPDRTPGEIFITMSKEGSTIGGTMNCFGTAISLGLQYGVPIKQFCSKFKGQNYEPRGLVKEGDPNIKISKSIIDYIFSWLAITFPEEKSEEEKADEQLINLALREAEKEEEERGGKPEAEELGGFCPRCGKRMTKKGHCMEICLDCTYSDTRGCGE